MAGMPDFAKIYAGFQTYENAHAAWESYALYGTLPLNLTAITPEMTAIANKLRHDMISLRAAQAAAVERLPAPSPALTGRHPGPARPPASIPRQVNQSMSSSSPSPGPSQKPGVRKSRGTSQTQSKPPNPGSASWSLQHTVSVPPGYWVVFVGFAPGVFPDRYGV